MSSENKSDDILTNLLTLYGKMAFEHGLDLIRKDKFIQSLEESGLCQHGKHYSKVENGYPVIDKELIRDESTRQSHAAATQHSEELVDEMRKDGFIYPRGTYHYGDTAWKVDRNCDTYKDAKRSSVTFVQLKAIFDGLEDLGLTPRFEEFERNEEGYFMLRANFDRATQLAKFRMQEPVKEGRIISRAVQFLRTAIEPLPTAFNAVLSKTNSIDAREMITHSSYCSLIQGLFAALDDVVPLLQYLLKTLKQTESNTKALHTTSAGRIRDTMRSLFSNADLYRYLAPTNLFIEAENLSRRDNHDSVMAEWLRPVWSYVIAAYVVTLACSEFTHVKSLGDITERYQTSLAIYQLGDSLYSDITFHDRRPLGQYFNKPPRYITDSLQQKVDGIEEDLSALISTQYNKHLGRYHAVSCLLSQIYQDANANSH